MKHLIGTLAFASLIIAGASASPTRWAVDKAHTNVKFVVSHMVVAEVGGRFTEFDVVLDHSKEDFADAALTATIKTASINTDDEKRDGHLRSDDFLNAEKFPVMKFVSTSWEKTGKDTYKIKGDLTIRDITRPVVLDATYNGVMKDPWGNTKAGFKATTTVNRMDFGVKWNKTLDAGGLLVGEDIDITLLVELVKK